jgi:hypothetical protein
VRDAIRFTRVTPLTDVAMLRLLNRGAFRRQFRLSLTTRFDAPCLRPRLLAFKPTIRYNTAQRRSLIEIPTILLPPVIFAGLVVSLWTWKCFMMVIFQNKIIYMPGLPPNSRREKIADYKNQCAGIHWQEEKTKSLDGTPISLCVASVESDPVAHQRRETVYILYFQGQYIPLMVTSVHQLIDCR